MLFCFVGTVVTISGALTIIKVRTMCWLCLKNGGHSSLVKDRVMGMFRYQVDWLYLLLQPRIGDGFFQRRCLVPTRSPQNRLEQRLGTEHGTHKRPENINDL